MLFGYPSFITIFYTYFILNICTHFYTNSSSPQAYLAAADFSTPFNLSQARVNAALAETKAAAKAAAESRDAPPSKAEASAAKSSAHSDAAAASSLAADMLRSIPQVLLFEMHDA